MLGRRMIGVVLALALGCEPVAYEGAASNEACPPATPTAGGETGSPDELSELMAELIAPRICQQVTGAFIGLPGDETHEGPAAGLDPSVGRWWIRRCAADVVDQQLRVAIGGPGWTWLDRESTGFRVRQYLRFEAEATFTASLHVGYDARTRVASIWLRPAPGVTAHVEPTGLVQAEATGVFSSLLGGILDLTGSSASDRARTQAAEEGSQRLTERLATGFTVTYQLDSAQMDFMLGELQRGQTPERPWPLTPGAWIVNERSMVWPGGMDVLGPIPPDAGEVTLEAELEEGDGAVMRRVCEDDLHRWLDGAWSGRQQAPPGEPVAELRATHRPHRAALTAAGCRSLLIVSPTARASLPARLRYRVTPVEAPPPGGGVVVANQGGTTGASGSAPTGPTPGGVARRTVRIQIRSVAVNAENASGGSWDLFRGDPDPYIVVSSIAEGRELHRTNVVDDTREARLDVWLPAAVRLDQLPVRFVVYDEDVAGDEVIGSADLEASQISDAQVDITLDLRSQGSTPGQTGVLRLRLQPQDQ